MQTEHAQALITIAAMAAFADGQKSEQERARFRDIVAQLGVDGLDPSAIVTGVLLKRADVDAACKALDTPELRALAYEFAVCLCDADGPASANEQAFLADLRRRLLLDNAPAAAVLQEAESLAALPVTEAAATPPPLPAAAVEPARVVDPSPMILKYAILCSCLELLPQGVANLAIMPLQMKMVYRVGRDHGFPLDKGHIVELLGVLGVSATGQMLEGVARKFLGKFGGALAGGIGKAVARGATGAALTFATTYALGHVAHRYYGGGRRLDRTALQGLFGELKTQAASLYPRYADQIQQQSTQVNVSSLLSGRGLP
mgnify:CR=1 FL=1